ncbi:hypothetical protein HDU67_007786 [Dinochytrium kinnereticum]|nr:hypothetical protein HDU67_007786 [Dinochytrium kinnereticum]
MPSSNGAAPQQTPSLETSTHDSDIAAIQRDMRNMERDFCEMASIFKRTADDDLDRNTVVMQSTRFMSMMLKLCGALPIICEGIRKTKEREGQSDVGEFQLCNSSLARYSDLDDEVAVLLSRFEEVRVEQLDIERKWRQISEGNLDLKMVLDHVIAAMGLLLEISERLPAAISERDSLKQMMEKAGFGPWSNGLYGCSLAGT